MDFQDQVRQAEHLVTRGYSDEDIERMTGVSLLRLIELRGIEACRPPEPGRRLRGGKGERQTDVRD